MKPVKNVESRIAYGCRLVVKQLPETLYCKPAVFDLLGVEGCDPLVKDKKLGVVIFKKRLG